MVTVVSSNICPYCSVAKQLITSLGFEYEEVVVGMGSPELMEIVQKTGLMSVPQIFAGDISKENLLGGFDEINALNNEGKLVDIFNNIK
ncbi:glutaredoxin [Candidatus Gracilibacteria bacterium]|nr:glutaredoxin [Candidatus Gracilibacteria bacterium]